MQRGVSWYQKGCVRKALDHFFAAHEYYCLVDNRIGVARSMDGIGNAYRLMGDQKNAILFYDAAISTSKCSEAENCEDRSVAAQALANKAALLLEMEDFPGARVVLDEAQSIVLEQDTIRIRILNHRAVLAMKTGQTEEAVSLLDQADSFSRKSGVDASLRFTRGRLMVMMGNEDEAMPCFQQALTMDRKAGRFRAVADDLCAIAGLYEKQGNIKAALDHLDRSIKIYALIGERREIAEQLDKLQSLADKSGTDIRVTVHFIEQWLAGNGIDAACR